MRFPAYTDSAVRLIPPGILVVAGIVDVRVHHGELLVRGGVFEDRPELQLTRAGPPRLSRIVLLGHNGSVSLAALRWISDIGASIIQVDYDSRVVLSSGPPGLNLPALRRAQSLAAHTPAGLEIVRELLSAKLTGQAEVCRQIGNEGAASQVERSLDRLRTAPTLAKLKWHESRAAAAYWSAWASIPVLFARADHRKPPHHWTTFGPRTSSLTDSPRKAIAPATAIQNYLYSLLRAEATIGAITIGLDPGQGILHTDQPARDSLSLDLMEACRPACDEWLLRLLRERHFARSDFVELPDGEVRMVKPLAHEMAMTLPLWAKAVAPVVERIAQSLLTRPSRAGRYAHLPTKLTETNRSRSKQLSFSSLTHQSGATTAGIPKACIQCGMPARKESRYCSKECQSIYLRETRAPGFAKAGAAALKALRASGEDPAHGGEAAKRRGSSNGRRAKDREAWKLLGLDLAAERSRFITEIQPRLSTLTARQITDATGLTTHYANLILGGYVPHPVHNDALAALTSKQVAPGVEVLIDLLTIHA